MSIHFHLGNVLAVLPTLEAASVDCVITSPPYYGLRDYKHPEQLGAEATPQDYVESMSTVFREVLRVLRPSGTLWLNLGDSYATAGGLHGNRTGNQVGVGARRTHLAGAGDGKHRRPQAGVPAKSLLGIPWRVAFALQNDGWVLRQEIIWHKPNPMPESVTDRFTRAHEHVFLFSKAPPLLLEPRGRARARSSSGPRAQ